MEKLSAMGFFNFAIPKKAIQGVKVMHIFKRHWDRCLIYQSIFELLKWKIKALTANFNLKFSQYLNNDGSYGEDESKQFILSL